MDDLDAVMKATGVKRAALFGFFRGRVHDRTVRRNPP
jgi:hypothetical protein